MTGKIADDFSRKLTTLLMNLDNNGMSGVRILRATGNNG